MIALCAVLLLVPATSGTVLTSDPGYTDRADDPNPAAADTEGRAAHLRKGSEFSDSAADETEILTRGDEVGQAMPAAVTRDEAAAALTGVADTHVLAARPRRVSPPYFVRPATPPPTTWPSPTPTALPNDGPAVHILAPAPSITRTVSNPPAAPAAAVPTAVPTAFPTRANSTLFRFYVSRDLLPNPFVHDFDTAGFQATVMARLIGFYAVPTVAMQMAATKIADAPLSLVMSIGFDPAFADDQLRIEELQKRYELRFRYPSPSGAWHYADSAQFPDFRMVRNPNTDETGRPGCCTAARVAAR